MTNHDKGGALLGIVERIEDLEADKAAIQAQIREVKAEASPALLRALCEGVKRTLVVGERAGREINGPDSVFGPVLSAVAPAPEYEPPPLWANPADGVRRLAGIAWPLPRPR